MTRSRRHFGFTLLELILVMVIITTALAMAAPSLGGWGRGAKLRDIGDQFLSVTRYARSQAIADAQVYRLNIDSSAGKYWLTMQSGQQFVELGNSFGQAFTIPEGYRIAQVADPSTPADGGAAAPIDFQPDGRCTPARFQITSDLGPTVEIASTLPTEPFAVMDSTGGQR